MYIFKNALRCIGRSMGRNVLIGIIALVIAISACIGLSIRQAAVSAKESALAGMRITATISFNRSNMMNQIGKDFNGFDRDQFIGMMGGSPSSLTLEEYQIYANAESVQYFYYTLTAYLNGNDSFLPVSDEKTDDGGEETKEPDLQLPGGFENIMGNFMGGGFSTGDFTVVGFSSDLAMTDFQNGTTSMLGESKLFDEGTSEMVCVISQELALFNGLSLGDTITLTNPALESESYELSIVGIYASSQTNDFSQSMFGTSQDPANKIYLSAGTLQVILNASAENNTTVTNETTGKETNSKLTATLAATYTFADADDYYAFEEEARALGLDDNYTVSSSDISSFESSIEPLKTLGTMAGWFLIVILIIGGVILVVLNIFNVRERKYEVGVLTAMGMKKWKVAAQFMCEILVVTMIAVVLGACVGAVSSVPVTNALLANQIASQNAQQNQLEQNMGRPGNMGNMIPGGNMMPGGKNPFESMLSGATDYITQVDSAMNLTVVVEMIGVGLLLTLIASAASILFIMRYDPLKILTNRD